MTRIYLVRHAESVANTQGIYQGQTYDTSLSPLGLLQAQRLSEKLRTTKLDRVIVSPLTRTRMTGEAIAMTHSLPAIAEPAIIETNHGEWEGVHKLVISQKWPELHKLWLTSPSQAVFPAGESFVQTAQRTLTWWERIKKSTGDTLIVSHDNILRVIIADTLNMDLDSIWSIGLHPAAISNIEIFGNEAKLVCLNDTNHLNGARIDISTHAL